MSQFSTQTFQRLVREYLRRDEMDVLVQEMMERLSDEPFSVHAAGSLDVGQAVQRFSHPCDSSQILLVVGTILPHDQSIAVLSAQVASLNS